jgi:hypothetical protein
MCVFSVVRLSTMTASYPYVCHFLTSNCVSDCLDITLIIIKFSSDLLMSQLNSTVASYKASTK